MSTSQPATDSGTTPDETGPNTGSATFFGHPRMLANLFFVEMWERFSFYGMQIILVFYLYYSVADGGLGLDKTAATGVIGAYGGMVYLMAIVGGYLGDKVLGPERTMFYSAIGIMAGHIALALIPGLGGVVFGLVLIAIGSGGLKTNASVLIGSLYSLTDSRRDAGFTIFYMGINIGALLGPLATNFAWDISGFHLGFGIAAIGMALGLTQYALTRKNLPAEVHHVSNPASPGEKKKVLVATIAFTILIVVLVVLGLISPQNIESWVIGLIAICTVVLFVILFRSDKVDEQEHSRVKSFVPLWFGSVIFWSLYQQQFTVMAIYSDTRLNWNIFGMELKPGLFNSINPLFIILLGTLFSVMWTKMGDKQPSIVSKFALGLVGAGIAFAIFLLPSSQDVVNVGWLVGVLFVITMAELTISPTGISLTTKLAPTAHKSQMMALYWTSIGMGTTLAGWMAQFYSRENEVAYFSTMAIMSLLAGIAVFIGRKSILTMMRGVR
ncbi:oligopeptide:H+ symporter [Corynebacterium sp. MSK297]|uniref:peptide MFS transporter n=1 Tax=Corynebacterium sp. MSK297 TaxID=3050221 RepID=UPI00254D96D8|nr:oligopeptide:H+ symporter [Corynebacterium sp. MSK297]MDK8846908.1 oligopeptide:H+ symporter [Corynebacterium sp. MSK297]